MCYKVDSTPLLEILLQEGWGGLQESGFATSRPGVPGADSPGLQLEKHWSSGKKHRSGVCRHGPGRMLHYFLIRQVGMERNTDTRGFGEIERDEVCDMLEIVSQVFQMFEWLLGGKEILNGSTGYS